MSLPESCSEEARAYSQPWLDLVTEQCVRELIRTISHRCTHSSTLAAHARLARLARLPPRRWIPPIRQSLFPGSRIFDLDPPITDSSVRRPTNPKCILSKDFVALGGLPMILYTVIVKCISGIFSLVTTVCIFYVCLESTVTTLAEGVPCYSQPKGTTPLCATNVIWVLYTVSCWLGLISLLTAIGLL
jgi:hypothetical protein